LREKGAAGKSPVNRLFFTLLPYCADLQQILVSKRRLGLRFGVPLVAHADEERTSVLLD
jgi:hypothetical protein